MCGSTACVTAVVPLVTSSERCFVLHEPLDLDLTAEIKWAVRTLNSASKSNGCRGGPNGTSHLDRTRGKFGSFLKFLSFFKVR